MRATECVRARSRVKEWVRAKVRAERQDRPPRHQRRDIGEREGGGKKGPGKCEGKDIGEDKGKEENINEGEKGRGQERVRVRARTDKGEGENGGERARAGT